MFSCEFCEISKNTFLTEHLRTTASLFTRDRRQTLDTITIPNNSMDGRYIKQHDVIENNFWELNKEEKLCHEEILKDNLLHLPNNKSGISCSLKLVIWW